MKQKKLLLLGGLRYLLPVIETAHKEGYYVITCDYLPDNIAHKYSDEYHNVSIIDKEAVLKLAQELKIDGIMSFAVDPGVVTAAYVAEKMNLPFQCSYETACILQDKAKFRKFLKDNGFNCPKAKGYSNIEEALNDKDRFDYPVIVKPVDSAGSKGVTKVERKEDLLNALRIAMSESHTNNIIVEDFLDIDEHPSGSESFFINGELKYNGFYDQYFDKDADNPFTPMAECWPSQKSETYLNYIKNELQRLARILKFRTGIFNIEFRISNGIPYIMEVSPRAGGNRLAEVLRYATDIDIIQAEVKKSVGDPTGIISEPKYKNFFANVVLHCNKAGILKEIIIDYTLSRFLIEKDIRINKGDFIHSFNGANNSIGQLFMKFTTREELNLYIDNINKYVNIIVTNDIDKSYGGGIIE